MSTAGLQLAWCRSCEAPIFWLKNDSTGKPAPIDVDPNPEGPVIITVEEKALTYHVLTDAELAAGVDVDRYTNHFQRCPFAAKHKKT